MKILPKIQQLYRRVVSPSVKKAVETPVTVPISKAAEPAVQATKTARQNPYMEYIYQSYEQDGVSRDIVDRVVMGGERLRYYRYVGSEELEKLLSGKRITSTRPCHNGCLTDVTSNPDYGEIPTLGKYRLSFKDKPEFCPYPIGNEKNSRILEHNLGNQEFYIRGGYDISDIEKIEQKIDSNIFRNLQLLG